MSINTDANCPAQRVFQVDESRDLPVQIAEDALRLSRILQGKIVTALRLAKPDELELEFVDGSRLFVDLGLDGLELSIIRIEEGTTH